MYLDSLSLKNYRNHKETIIKFNNGINVIFGDNAQGKTNILESIYVCSTSKSYRTKIDKEIIMIGEEDANISLSYIKNRKNSIIDINIKKNTGKKIAINKTIITNLSQLLGNINIIFFSPEDLGLIKNGPKDRRRFMNVELCQLNPIYYYNIKQYNKVLKQRNNLLRLIRMNKMLKDDLDIWDYQLVKYATIVKECREEFINDLRPILNKIHKYISGDKEDLYIEYETIISKEEYMELLINNRDKDIKNGSTGYGPHKDDIKIELNGIDIRKYGSQGQQRTAALSLKLSEIEIVKSIIDESPILLLDDVLSELDKTRQRLLIEFLKDIQTIITCTGVEDFLKKNLIIDKTIEISNGTVINAY